LLIRDANKNKQIPCIRVKIILKNVELDAPNGNDYIQLLTL